MTATYCTLADLRGPTGVLDQFTSGGVAITTSDTLLQACLDDAQAIIDGELGFTLTAAAAGSQVVYGDGTPYLTPPLFTPASVTSVTAPSGYTVPSYVERDGILVTTNTSGVLLAATHDPYYADYVWRINPLFEMPTGAWVAGVPYTVAASFGATADDLRVARRITLELAVQFYRFREAGGAQVLGTENSTVVVKNAFSPVVRGAIERLKQRHGLQGVW